ncbi:MAG: DUF4864 domain-containing protein [Betaproteobacteria bacterium]
MRKLLLKIALLLSLSLLAGTSAMATPVTEQDTRDAQQVVRAQLAAFAADDAEQAFSLATDAIRAQFGTASQFIRMVRGAYPVVYRPSAVVFLKPDAADDELVQPVHMTDPSGSTWLAVYRLQRQADKSWRIGGCVLVPHAGKTV